MVIVDTALKKRAEEGHPIRVGLVGAGFMGRGIALQISRYTPGMELVAISNRHTEKAQEAYRKAGVANVQTAECVGDLEDFIKSRRHAVTEDALLLCQAEGIDAIIEATGTVEFAAHVAVEAIKHGKHLILMNAELDGTIGPILKNYADRAGVVYTLSDGDQPGVTMNLYRFVKSPGVRPVLCGNIKGLHDRYRNPTTQEAFARKWGQNPHMVTAFADDTKISFEQAVVANGTGMRVATRGMWGPEVPQGTSIDEAVEQFPTHQLLEGPGYVDYLVGASPSPGVFVLGSCNDPVQREYLRLYKLGKGPLYCFHTPYHLCHFEVPNTVARAAIFGDPTLTPENGPRVDVIAAAKKPASNRRGHRWYGPVHGLRALRELSNRPQGKSLTYRACGRLRLEA